MKKITFSHLKTLANSWQVVKVLSLLMLMSFWTACKKSSDSTSTSSEAIVYIKGAEIVQSHIIEPWNDGNTVTLSFSGAYTGIEDLFKQAPSDIDMTFNVDLEKIEAYNTENGTDYLPIPAASLSATSFSSMIEQDQNETAELTLNIDIAEGIQPFTNYLLPISIGQVSGEHRIDERKRTIYFKLFKMDNTPVDIKVGILTNTSGNMNMSLVANIANAEDPDILVVREIDKVTTRSGGVDKADELKDLLHIKNYRFIKQQDLQGGEFGVVIYSRYPFKSFSQHILTSSGAATGRPLGVSELDVHGQTLRVAAVNLDFQPIGMLDNINHSLGHIGHDNTPIVFLGTFQQNPNVETNSVYQALFGAGYVLPCQVCPPTYGHPTQTAWTDMVVFRPYSRFDVVPVNGQYVKVLPTSVSNTPHKPVFTTLRVYFYSDKE